MAEYSETKDATVYVVDGWDPDTERSFVFVYEYRPHAVAKADVLRLKHPNIYVGVARRKVK